MVGEASTPSSDFPTVTPEMIRELNGLGYRDIPARQLVALRIHGASPQWIRGVRAAMGG